MRPNRIPQPTMELAWSKVPFITPVAQWLEKKCTNVVHFDHATPEFLEPYVSAWYLSPEQHVFEYFVSLIFLIPILKRGVRHIKEHVRGIEKRNIVQWPSNGPTRLWAIACLLILIAQLPYKADMDSHVNNPVFILQPCHIILTCFIISSFIATSSSWSVYLLHAASLLIWGPALAFAFPALPNTYAEIVIFWTEHILLLLSPIFTVYNSSIEVHSNLWFQWFPFILIVCYHWWALAPACMLSGVNVATMMIPPPVLSHIGPFYRFLQIFICIALHFISVMIHKMLFMLFGWFHGPSFPVAVQPRKTKQQ